MSTHTLLYPILSRKEMGSGRLREKPPGPDILVAYFISRQPDWSALRAVWPLYCWYTVCISSIVSK